METVNMHKAKTRLSQLADVVRRLGFMRGHIAVPDDFYRMAEEQIAKLFGGQG